MTKNFYLRNLKGCHREHPLHPHTFTIMNDSIGKLINWIIKHKYLAVTIIFLLILIFFDENNIIKHIQLRRQESRLKADIEALQQEHDIIMRKLGELEKDAEMLEKVAREKYGMHLDNEEIFIIKD